MNQTQVNTDVKRRRGQSEQNFSRSRIDPGGNSIQLHESIANIEWCNLKYVLIQLHRCRELVVGSVQVDELNERKRCT